MSSLSGGNTAINTLRANYSAYEAKDTTGNKGMLGKDAFLTLLCAQLENQNPLDPTDTSSFSDQLAQFSQVEEMINVNKTLEAMLKNTTKSGSTANATDYVGMQVTGKADSMIVKDGSVSSGFYTLSKPAEVIVVVSDKDGNVVTTLTEGQQKAGSFLVTWDGTDASGNAVKEGTYTYAVKANAGSGYKQIPSTVTGTVSAVAYQNGTAYLVVGGILLDPSSLTSATKPGGKTPDDNGTAILQYLGKTVSSDFPLVQVEDDKVTGKGLGYHLDTPSAVTITIYNARNEVVATMEVASKDTVAGDNEVSWDALADNGKPVSEGLYYYKVETPNGASVSTSTSGKVTGIQYVNGVQYLALGESGRLISLPTITSVQ